MIRRLLRGSAWNGLIGCAHAIEPVPELWVRRIVVLLGHYGTSFGDCSDDELSALH